MKAAVWHAKEDIRIEEVPDPTPASGEVVIQVERTGICGTDLHEYTSGPLFAIPQTILGHEYSGTVVDMARDVTGFRVGDRVAGVGVTGCGVCYYCRHGLTGICDSPTFIGLRRPGALAPLASMPASALFVVPDELSLAEAALVEPLGVAFHAVRRSRLAPGETVYVAGAGPIGLGVIQTARAAGASEIIVSEVSSRRRAAATELGATRVIDPTIEDTLEITRSLTFGRGADVGFDTAGVQAAFDPAIAAIRKRGRFVVVAAWERPAAFEMSGPLLREIELIFTFCYEAEEEIPQLLKLLARGDIQAAPMITSEIPLDAVVAKGFQELRDHRDVQVKILVNPAVSA
ncbi:MAG: 2,3-butanediol dehydrogenase [Microbacterium sp.]|uniref:2,3-butanediol dehydrogenase n=1 Tax=Microbacterium sp. TaxID=51671 RepID=UPI00271FCA96|nr:2,3-butanediol dehydrogenase [Microbacterium sp.]MDO8383849.1 2,3-butanediol dehydrogenase [Microbacterium sp.]